MSGRQRDARGVSASVEMAILIPVLVLVLGLVVAGGRLALARLSVQQWADSAARSATLARDALSAEHRARTVVASDAFGSQTPCRASWFLAIDTSAFARPAGEEGSVTVTVSCAIPLADLLLPGVPGTITLEKSATSTLDRYRGRR